MRAHANNSPSYTTLLSRALLLTPNLPVPDSSVTDGDDFLNAFEVEARALLCRKRAPRVHNLLNVRTHETLGPIVRAIEEQRCHEVQRYLTLFERMRIGLEGGIPSLETVERLCGQSFAKTTYQPLVERLCNHPTFDIDAAFSAGSTVRWNQRRVLRVEGWMQIYCNTFETSQSAYECGELYEQYCRSLTRAQNDTDRMRIDLAHQLGVWRVRKADRAKWQRALNEEEWQLYQRGEQAMRTTGRGVFTYIPRRHFSAASVTHMRETNLPTIVERWFSADKAN